MLAKNSQMPGRKTSTRVHLTDIGTHTHTQTHRNGHLMESCEEVAIHVTSKNGDKHDSQRVLADLLKLKPHTI